VPRKVNVKIAFQVLGADAQQLYAYYKNGPFDHLVHSQIPHVEPP
jgi:hypothetical protein